MLASREGTATCCCDVCVEALDVGKDWNSFIGFMLPERPAELLGVLGVPTDEPAFPVDDGDVPRVVVLNRTPPVAGGRVLEEVVTFNLAAFEMSTT